MVKQCSMPALAINVVLVCTSLITKAMLLLFQPMCSPIKRQRICSRHGKIILNSGNWLARIDRATVWAAQSGMPELVMAWGNPCKLSSSSKLA